MSPTKECGPVQHHLDGTESTATISTHQDARSAVDPTARPRPDSLLGAQLLHDLIRNGYRVAGVCRGCGAALTNPRSMAAGFGPTCAARATR